MTQPWIYFLNHLMKTLFDIEMQIICKDHSPHSLNHTDCRLLPVIEYFKNKGIFTFTRLFLVLTVVHNRGSYGSIFESLSFLFHLCAYCFRQLWVGKDMLCFFKICFCSLYVYSNQSLKVIHEKKTNWKGKKQIW